MSTVEEIQKAAISLPEAQRTELIDELLDSMGMEHHEVSDEEVLQRKKDWDDGKVEGLTWEKINKNLR